MSGTQVDPQNEINSMDELDQLLALASSSSVFLTAEAKRALEALLSELNTPPEQEMPLLPTCCCSHFSSATASTIRASSDPCFGSRCG